MAKPPPPKKMKILEPEPEDKKNLSVSKFSLIFSLLLHKKPKL